MKTCTFDDFRPVLAIVALAVCVTVSPRSHADELQVGRYSTLPALPTAAQADLLVATVTISFPARIYTVGEAVKYLLQRSGYRLANEQVLPHETADLLALPLPAVQRNLGPVMLEQALETLAGPSFHLINDPVHRLISFELCPAAGRLMHQAADKTKMEASQDGE